MACSAGCGAGLSCQICSVISQLSKAGKSIVLGGVWGRKGGVCGRASPKAQA